MMYKLKFNIIRFNIIKFNIIKFNIIKFNITATLTSIINMVTTSQQKSSATRQLDLAIGSSSAAKASPNKYVPGQHKVTMDRQPVIVFL